MPVCTPVQYLDQVGELLRVKHAAKGVLARLRARNVDDRALLGELHAARKLTYRCKNEHCDGLDDVASGRDTCRDRDGVRDLAAVDAVVRLRRQLKPKEACSALSTRTSSSLAWAAPSPSISDDVASSPCSSSLDLPSSSAKLVSPVMSASSASNDEMLAESYESAGEDMAS